MVALLAAEGRLATWLLQMSQGNMSHIDHYMWYLWFIKHILMDIDKSPYIYMWHFL